MAEFAPVTLIVEKSSLVPLTLKLARAVVKRSEVKDRSSDSNPSMRTSPRASPVSVALPEPW